LVLAHETGHRIGAIRQLRWSDVDLKEKRILWRAENDKIGMEHSPPL
jgi:integrase